MQNGVAYLPVYLESNLPLDLVTIMLGTNDLKSRFNCTPSDIAQGVASLVRKVLTSGCGPNGGAPKVLLLSPPHIGATEHFMEVVFEGKAEDSVELADHYQTVAEFYNIEFFDTASVVKTAHG